MQTDDSNPRKPRLFGSKWPLRKRRERGRRRIVSTRYPRLQALQSGSAQKCSAFADHRSRLQWFAAQLLPYPYRQGVLLAETPPAYALARTWCCGSAALQTAIIAWERITTIHKGGNILAVEPEQVYAAESGGLEGRAQVEDTRTSGTRLAARPAEQDRRRALQSPRVKDSSPASTGS